jgi:hypothetical protein
LRGLAPNAELHRVFIFPEFGKDHHGGGLCQHVGVASRGSEQGGANLLR